MQKVFNPLTGQMEDVNNTQTMAPAPVVDEPAITVQPKPQTQVIPVETVKTQTKQIIAAPEEAKLEKERQELLKNEIQNQQRSMELDKELALVKEQKAAQEAAIKQEKQLKLEEQLKKDEEIRQQDLSAIQSAREEAKNFKFQDYWADKSTANKLLAAFAVGVGALGGAISGNNQNTALDIINKTIDRDYQLQKDKLSKLQSEISSATEQSNLNRQTSADALARLDASFAGKLDSVASQFEQKLLKMGVPAAEIANNKIINDIKNKANEIAQRAEEGKRTVREIEKLNETKVIEGKLPQVTEGQGKARGFASRMVEATKQFDKEGGISPDAVEKIQRWQQQNAILSETVVPGFGKVSQLVIKPGVNPLPSNISEKDKRAYLAVEEFARANLRKESGAAIGVDEMQSELNQYLPRPGDSKETIQQKRRIMTNKLAALQQEVGEGAKINIPKEPAQNKQASRFPVTLRKGNQIVTVDNEQELKEAQGEGWN